MTILTAVVTDPEVESAGSPVPERLRHPSHSVLVVANPRKPWVVEPHHALDDGFRELSRRGHELADRHASRDATSRLHLRNWVWKHPHESALSRLLDLAGDGR